MEKPVEASAQAEDKHSIGWGSFILWPFVVLVLYVLSIGPVVMMIDKGAILPMSNKWLHIYDPLEWAYDKTPLHRPLGMYLHLWSKRFKANGDQ